MADAVVEVGVDVLAVVAAAAVVVAVDIEVESPEVEDAAALLVAARGVESEAEIDRPHCPRAAGTLAVAIDQTSAVPVAPEIARAASEVPVDLAWAESEIGQVGLADPEALVASAARAALEIGQGASEALVASAGQAVLETGRVASVDQEVSATDLESAIDLESVIGSRTPATDTTFGRTPTTTGITGTGTAIGALGASARWHGA